MSLAFTRRPGRALALGVAISLCAHGAVAAWLLAYPAADQVPQDPGLKGRAFIDLAEVDMLMLAPDTLLTEGDAAADSAAQLDSPEATEAAETARDPLLAQIPYRVDDPELTFRISSPDEPIESDRKATEVATVQQDTAHTEFAPPSAAASPAPSDGTAQQSSATDAEIGLSDAALAQIEQWQKDIVLALAKAKTYPRAARRARAEGKVTLGFTLDGYGRVIARSVEESSGHAVLDEAALALIDQLDRLPAPPAAMGPGPFPMRVPISYSFK